MQAAMPMLIVYVIFAGREIAWVRDVLAMKPIQLIGLASYSIYLWQQLFLAKPDRYLVAPFPLWALPIVVVASVVLVERPFIRLGRRLSAVVLRGNRAGEPTRTECAVLPAP
jgi:peptidoglycan/LPS O-acetylase OafA/YrhL